MNKLILEEILDPLNRLKNIGWGAGDDGSIDRLWSEFQSKLELNAQHFENSSVFPLFEEIMGSSTSEINVLEYSSSKYHEWVNAFADLEDGRERD